MMAVAISVIIPVYNVECYLHRSVDSVLTQSFKDIEIILVDDGSTDGSGKICDEYARKDDRIKVIHKENGGLVSARKAGFEASCGKYIANIDSDDWVEPNHLEILFAAMRKEQADISQIGFFINSDEKQEAHLNRPTSTSPSQLIVDFLSGKVHSSVCGKLIDRKLYEQPNFRFPPCDFNEDLHTSISLVINVSKYVYTPVCTYHYRMNPSSMTKRLSREVRFRHYMECAANLQDIKDRLGIDEHLIFERMNPGKRDLLKFYPNAGGLLKDALQYFPNSFLLNDVRTIGDFFYYLGSRWQIIWPYKIKTLFR